MSELLEDASVPSILGVGWNDTGVTVIYIVTVCVGCVDERHVGDEREVGKDVTEVGMTVVGTTKVGMMVSGVATVSSEKVVSLENVTSSCSVIVGLMKARNVLSSYSRLTASSESVAA